MSQNANKRPPLVENSQRDAVVGERPCGGTTSVKITTVSLSSNAGKVVVPLPWSSYCATVWFGKFHLVGGGRWSCSWHSPSAPSTSGSLALPLRRPDNERSRSSGGSYGLQWSSSFVFQQLEPPLPPIYFYHRSETLGGTKEVNKQETRELCCSGQWPFLKRKAGNYRI